MTAVKESSTRNHNKGVAISACPVTYVMNKIGSHWKPIIIFQLMSGPKRYSELRRAIPEVTEKMLIQHLKQLQADNLINRKAEAVVPPVVTYSLTQSGLLLTPILDSMVAWALEEMAG
ncbi:MAG: transcriptional regulator [Pedobacter sp.]|jgi:DNA-binding HxlR family transcriptional regulator|nr:MAG: transcriptional regulator [Pedobacter sp.]